MQVADFMRDAATVADEMRSLASVCSATEWEDSAALRTALLDLPCHHQRSIFTHLATLVPLNALLTTLRYDLVPLLVAALVHNGGAAAGSEPAAAQGAGKEQHSALVLPASRPGARQRWGAAALTPAAYNRLFLELPALASLTAVSLEGQRLGGEGVRAAAVALQGHVHLMHLNLCRNELDARGCALWRRCCRAGRPCVRCCCPITSC
jgi:hypothetical protein